MDDKQLIARLLSGFVQLVQDGCCSESKAAEVCGYRLEEWRELLNGREASPIDIKELRAVKIENAILRSQLKSHGLK